MRICLIGSTRFSDYYKRLNLDLSAMGHIVHTVASLGMDINEKEKSMLDLVHLRKIILSEQVLVVTNPNTYVGESTAREITWAGINNIPVHYSRGGSIPDHLYRLAP